MPRMPRIPPGHFRPIPLPRRAAYTPPNFVPVVQFPQAPNPYLPAWARGKDLSVRSPYEHHIDPADYYPMPHNPWAHMAAEREPMVPLEGYDDLDEFLELVDTELDYEGSASYYFGEDAERKRPFQKVLSLFKRKDGEKAPIEKLTEIAEVITAQPEKALQVAQEAQQAAIERLQPPPPPTSKAKKALVIGGITVGVVVFAGGLIWVGKKLA